MAIGPPTGMRDWLPQDALLRQHLMETIGRVYRLYGYLPIDTPSMEDLSVLLGKGGGENEKLLFKILKRGEKLAQVQEHGDLADYGLRFDLTVPLARFVATHQGKLPKIFRRYHIAPVWRADRPQLGRYREFYQCDIDVVGGASSAYEVEIITATERVLAALRLGKYRFRLSDQRLLPLLLQGLGVAGESAASIAITLDKLDKLGCAGVISDLQELLPRGSAAMELLPRFVGDADQARRQEGDRFAAYKLIRPVLEKIPDTAIRTEIETAIAGLSSIMDGVLAINKDSSLVFDPILVRGMDYYTGPIYEAVVEGFSSSILGGGRYDGLIGRFLGKQIPAVGCSIGFERILALLQQRGTDAALVTPCAILLREGADEVQLQIRAERLRSAGIPVEVYLAPDDTGKQLKYAEAAGIRWAIKHVADDLSLLVRYLPTREDRTMSLSEFRRLLLEESAVK